MTTLRDSINYLDGILIEEETNRQSCQYDHSWRKYSISRSGRFKSKTRKRNGVDGDLFVKEPSSVMEQEKKKNYSTSINETTESVTPVRDRSNGDIYKSYYETNL